MADQYGAGGGLAHSSAAGERPPRVHLPLRQQTAASPPDPVSLTQPRPDVQRTTNEYVETPFRPVCHASGDGSVVVDKSSDVGGDKSDSHHQQRTSSVLNRHDRHMLNFPINHNNNKKVVRNRGVVTKQPGASATFKKDSASSGAASAGPSGSDAQTECSIICRECGKCRCDACRQPRPMPSLWLCNNFCYCSVESCVDYASCLCCVKGLMYHCATRDGDDDTCADDPCSCGPHRLIGRWACLGFTSLLLPCLCCYWPLKGVAAACESCYARCTTRGCRCETSRHHHHHPTHQSTELTPEKRLLDSSPEY